MAKARTPETASDPKEQEKNLNKVLEIIQLMGENEIAELDLEVPGLKMSLRKNGTPEPAPVMINPMPYHPTMAENAFQSAPPAIADKKVSPKSGGETERSKPVEPANRHKILSPMAGTFYRAPSPTSPPYVNEGDAIHAGQAVCIVEAMKLMNEIKADKSGKILKILVENAKPVEKGTELFLIEIAG